MDRHTLWEELASKARKGFVCQDVASSYKAESRDCKIAAVRVVLCAHREVVLSIGERGGIIWIDGTMRYGLVHSI